MTPTVPRNGRSPLSNTPLGDHRVTISVDALGRQWLWNADEHCDTDGAEKRSAGRTGCPRTGRVATRTRSWSVFAHRLRYAAGLGRCRSHGAIAEAPMSSAAVSNVITACPTRPGVTPPAWSTT